jgi:hypothetical protein
MKHLFKLIVLAGFLGLAAQAAEPPTEQVLTFEDTAPAQARGTISTDLRPAPPKDLTPSGPIPAVTETEAQTGLPAIAAAGVEPVISPGGTVPAPLIPGQPLKTYATLADAAKAGIDPLRVPVEVSEALPEMAPASSTSWSSALAWARAQPFYLALPIGGATVLLLAALFWVRRRGAQR